MFYNLGASLCFRSYTRLGVSACLRLFSPYMYDSAWMTVKADGSVVLVELYILPFNDVWGSATESM